LADLKRELVVFRNNYGVPRPSRFAEELLASTLHRIEVEDHVVGTVPLHENAA
jgi:hypothetical protein